MQVIYGQNYALFLHILKFIGFLMASAKITVFTSSCIESINIHLLAEK